MSGELGRRSDSGEREAPPADKRRDLGVVVRHILAEYCDPAAVNFLLQIPEDGEDEENFFIWTDQQTLQIRSTRRGRPVSEEAEHGAQRREEPHASDGENDD